MGALLGHDSPVKPKNVHKLLLIYRFDTPMEPWMG